LESEGNQETEDDKFNRIDILTQNSKNELIIIEIQKTYEIDYRSGEPSPTCHKPCSLGAIDLRPSLVKLKYPKIFDYLLNKLTKRKLRKLQFQNPVSY
jgi:hypothetical protein